MQCLLLLVLLGFHLNNLTLLNCYMLLKNFFEEHNDYDIIHGQCSELGVFIYEEVKRRGIPVIIAHAHNNRMDRDKKLVFRLIWKKRMRKFINANKM